MNEAEPQSSEKSFYLRSFRHRAMLVHLAEGYDEAVARDVVEELVANLTLVVITARAFGGRRGIEMERRELAVPRAGMFELGTALIGDGLARVYQLPGSRFSQLRFSALLGRRLGVHKIVVVDPRGGIRGRGGMRSFVHAGMLARLAAHTRTAGGWTASELRLFIETVRSGVASINLTTAEGLATELFSYEGSGTLITPAEYCHVAPLHAEDFHQALVLLERGERDGFLLQRSLDEKARLLLSAFGAWFEGQRLAGIAGLETEAYKRRKLAEVVGLYTITRFKGEGVGLRILEALHAEARRRGCRAIFACTSNARAGQFFLRNGYRLVPYERLPAHKRRQPRRMPPLAYWLDL